MEKSIDVKRIESLEDLENALSRFHTEGSQSLDRIDAIHQRIQSELLQMLASAQTQLDVTLGMNHGSYLFPNQQPGEGQRGSGPIRKCLSEVDKQIHKYQKNAAKIKKLLDSDMIKARKMLKQKILELEKYVKASMGKTGNPTALEDPAYDDSCGLPVPWDGGVAQGDFDCGNRNADMTELSKSD